METLVIIVNIILYAIPILFAITLHEVAHGWAALKLGDPTAKMLGRLTVNPLKHIDPVGTIVIPTILFYLGGFIFGWVILALLFFSYSGTIPFGFVILLKVFYFLISFLLGLKLTIFFMNLFKKLRV